MSGIFGLQAQLCHCRLSLMQDQTLHVVGEIGKCNLGLRPFDANGADAQSHLRFLLSKDMLNPGSGFRFGGIALGNVCGHGPPLGLLVMDMRSPAHLPQPFLVGFGAVSRIGPDTGGGIISRHDLSQHLAIMSGSVSDREVANEAETAVYDDVVLVAKGWDGDVGCVFATVFLGLRLGELHRPSRIGVLLGGFGRFVRPYLISRLALFDRGLLVFIVALAWSRYPCRVHDLATHRQIARAFQLLDLVHLGQEYYRRAVTECSGRERQRGTLALRLGLEALKRLRQMIGESPA